MKFFIIALILLLIVMAVILFFVIFRNKKSDSEKPNINISVGGKVNFAGTNGNINYRDNSSSTKNITKNTYKTTNHNYYKSNSKGSSSNKSNEDILGTIFAIIFAIIFVLGIYFKLDKLYNMNFIIILISCFLSFFCFIIVCLLSKGIDWKYLIYSILLSVSLSILIVQPFIPSDLDVSNTVNELINLVTTETESSFNPHPLTLLYLALNLFAILALLRYQIAEFLSLFTKKKSRYYDGRLVRMIIFPMFTVFVGSGLGYRFILFLQFALIFLAETAKNFFETKV